MYIISEDSTEFVGDKHLLLELDTLKNPDTGVEKRFYCVIDELPVIDLPVIEHYMQAHANLISEYRKHNWDYCISACRGLRGKWNGTLDSFYDCLESRVHDILENSKSNQQ